MPGKGVADIFFMKSQTVPRQNLLCSNLAIDLNQLQLSHVEPILFNCIAAPNR